MNPTDPTAGSAPGSALPQKTGETRASLKDAPLNYYGLPITPPEYFDGEHVANTPPTAGLPPVCSCGWTRWQIEDEPRAGEWFEMSDHLADMGAT